MSLFNHFLIQNATSLQQDCVVPLYVTSLQNPGLYLYSDVSEVTLLWVATGHITAIDNTVVKKKKQLHF